MEYFSDASMSDSDSESESEEEPLYDERELEYWALEALLDSRGPPPVIEYAAGLGVVTLRECVLTPSRLKIEQIVDAKTAHSWKDYWRNKKVDNTCLFSAEDWQSIGEFCWQLCQCCVPNPSKNHVRSCMKNILKYGKFKKT